MTYNTFAEKTNKMNNPNNPLIEKALYLLLMVDNSLKGSDIYAALRPEFNRNQLNQGFNSWRNSLKMQAVKSELQALLKEYAKRELEGDFTPSKGTQNLRIDFSNRDEFIGYLNSSINELTDEQTKTKYLQMLSDLLRFKDSKPDESGKHMQFYRPLTCNECPLYKGVQPDEGKGDIL